MLSTSAYTSTNFGKTHFIVGLNRPQATPQNQEHEPKIRQVFFSPDHDLQSRFIELIDQEQESIKIAVYFFTNTPIAQALIKAHKRGVNIEIITDQSCTASKCARIRQLAESGMPVFVYIANKDKNSLMHNKFALFGKNAYGKRILWTGSFNFTKTATIYNQENVVVLDDTQMIDKFDQHFEVLKNRCAPFGGTTSCKATATVATAKLKNSGSIKTSWIREKFDKACNKVSEWYDACKVPERYNLG
jgi:phosphatidylserine/phosphatidylglycerophosphate/cardiolipin synthase-like enzyme